MLLLVLLSAVCCLLSAAVSAPLRIIIACRPYLSFLIDSLFFILVYYPYKFYKVSEMAQTFACNITDYSFTPKTIAEVKWSIDGAHLALASTDKTVRIAQLMSS